jgi:hypothetical protein
VCVCVCIGRSIWRSTTWLHLESPWVLVVSLGPLPEVQRQPGHRGHQREAQHVGGREAVGVDEGARHGAHAAPACERDMQGEERWRGGSGEEERSHFFTAERRLWSFPGGFRRIPGGVNALDGKRAGEEGRHPALLASCLLTHRLRPRAGTARTLPLGCSAE